MKQIIEWCLENYSLVRNIILILLSGGSYLFASLIHKKSSTRLKTLETENQIKQDLIASIQELKDALEKEKAANETEETGL